MNQKWSLWISDMEGKVAMVATRKRGKRASFIYEREKRRM